MLYSNIFSLFKGVYCCGQLSDLSIISRLPSIGKCSSIIIILVYRESQLQRLCSAVANVYRFKQLPFLLIMEVPNIYIFKSMTSFMVYLQYPFCTISNIFKTVCKLKCILLKTITRESRLQRIIANGVKSGKANVNFRIAQWSILGLLLMWCVYKEIFKLWWPEPNL